jgi:hypothetical protein
MNPVEVLKARCEYARSFQDSTILLPYDVAEALEQFVRGIELAAAKGSEMATTLLDLLETALEDN